MANETGSQCSGSFGGEFKEPAKMNDKTEGLTAREVEVLTRLAEENTNKEIAFALGLSTLTVDTYRKRIMMKLDVHSITGLVRFAIRNGLIKP